MYIIDLRERTAVPAIARGCGSRRSRTQTVDLRLPGYDYAGIRPWAMAWASGGARGRGRMRLAAPGSRTHRGASACTKRFCKCATLYVHCTCRLRETRATADPTIKCAGCSAVKQFVVARAPTRSQAQQAHTICTITKMASVPPPTKALCPSLQWEKKLVAIVPVMLSVCSPTY